MLGKLVLEIIPGKNISVICKKNSDYHTRHYEVRKRMKFYR
jgi:hypothetical protein